MGNSISGILATVFMSAIEERTLSALNIGLCNRYVDDIFCLTTSEEEAKAILHPMNIQNENIKFEIELPQDGTLSLLDFSVAYQSNIPSLKFYKKPAKKPIFMHFQS